MVKRERQARVAAEERAAHAEAQLHEQGPRFEQLEKELQRLKASATMYANASSVCWGQLDALEL